MMGDENRIAETFNGSTIFITGGTGFLGKVLIEKLLRSTKVKKIYLLIRNKKGKSPQERLNDIFTNMLFDSLKEEDPNCVTKCHAICGDISFDDLGISNQDCQLLEKEVDFIYHLAASTRFDDSVRTAVITNARSTKMLLSLAKMCQKLRAFVHVSTAFAFPKETILHETAYKPPADPHRVLALIKNTTDLECDKLIGDCPNTYTFSKALAEALVVEQIEQLPVLIVRPSVVCPILKDPLPGWCNTLQGPMGLFVGAGKGIIRSMYLKGDYSADIVPVDIVVNSLLIMTWNFIHNSKKVRIFNITNSSECEQSWKDIINTGKAIIMNEIPFNGVIWYPGGSIKKSKFLHVICFYLFQLLPALLIDALLIILGYKPILYQIQRRIEKGSKFFEYYTEKFWNFDNSKAREVRNMLNDKENEVYKVDAKNFDLRMYLINCLICVRRNNLKESDDTIPAAKRHMKIMWTVDVFCKLLLVLVVLYFCKKSVFQFFE